MGQSRRPVSAGGRFPGRVSYVGLEGGGDCTIRVGYIVRSTILSMYLCTSVPMFDLIILRSLTKYQRTSTKPSSNWPGY